LGGPEFELSKDTTSLWDLGMTFLGKSYEAQYSWRSTKNCLQWPVEFGASFLPTRKVQKVY